MRKVLIEARPERRTLVTATAAAGVKPVQGELALVVDTEAFLGYSPWFPGNPVWSGWYDVKGWGPFPELIERLWFDANMPAWRVKSETTILGGHPDLRWRGLAAPWPWGYRYDVPGAKHYRAQLLEA